MSAPTTASADAGSRFGHAVLTVVGWQAAAVVAFLLWAYSLPAHRSDGQCEGIGFGCQPGPQDTALLLGMVAGIPAVLISTVIASATAALLAFRFRHRGLTAGTLAWLAGWLVIACGAGALLATHAT